MAHFEKHSLVQISVYHTLPSYKTGSYRNCLATFGKRQLLQGNKVHDQHRVE